MKPCPAGRDSGGNSIVTIPVQITFRHMESSAAVETRVRELANHLGTFSDRIQGCRVVVDSPHRHQHHARPDAQEGDEYPPEKGAQYSG